MKDVLVKTHLIVTNVHDEYNINWCGKILDTKPQFKNGKPIFVVVGTKGRVELNTADMSRIEECAKRRTQPKGRSAVTEDTARIYLVEESGKEKLMGTVTHYRVKTFAPMYDTVGWR